MGLAFLSIFSPYFKYFTEKMQNYILNSSYGYNRPALRLSYSVISRMVKLKTTNINDIIDPIIKNIKNMLIYSDYIENKKLKFGAKKNFKIKHKLEYKFQQEKYSIESFTPMKSIALKYLDNNSLSLSQLRNYSFGNYEDKNRISERITNSDTYKSILPKVFMCGNSLEILNENFKISHVKHMEFLKLGDSKIDLKTQLANDFSKIPPSWMTGYEMYDDSMQDYTKNTKYGTPNINLKVSSVPCGGCGALLHCKNVNIPGYLPSELFINKSDSDLKSITCQRCHFMKYYNTCLDVKDCHKEYTYLLKQIQDNRKAIIILLIDLTDFPCSICPEISLLIGCKRHIFVVGNKIDLLPIDSSNFSEHIKDCLIDALIQTGINKANIKHISLISAKTGYGIDQLINKLSKTWKYRSDVYLVGCTNSGKSTLFNTLLQSDFCKSQAVDLVHQATISLWPGTTLNMLKFPILKLSNSGRFRKRTKKLIEERKCNHTDAYLRKLELKRTKQIKLASLQSLVSHTFKKGFEVANATITNFNVLTIDKKRGFELNDKSKEYINSYWCYDTPGTIQPDQILHLLTMDELIKTIPSKIISPRTFCLWSGQTLFIAGLGRLDILSAPSYVRCTVFASEILPVTICKIGNAQHIYNQLIQTEAFEVPINSYKRIKIWPCLQPKYLETVGIGNNESVSDVVLSNAGWIAISTKKKDIVTMKAWTPEGRGIYLRTPALLPKSVTLRGLRKIGSPAYNLGKQVYFFKG